MGEGCIVYAIDINPYAIKNVEKKIAKRKVINVKPMLLNVASTGFAEKSIDLAFFFGVIHNLIRVIDEVIHEMDRILTQKEIHTMQRLQY